MRPGKIEVRTNRGILDRWCDVCSGRIPGQCSFVDVFIDNKLIIMAHFQCFRKFNAELELILEKWEKEDEENKTKEV
ncbi:MAG: hypothetical protein ACW98X_24005 [Promethearchaeota archaeon]|jgi:hypothetical protein